MNCVHPMTRNHLPRDVQGGGQNGRVIEEFPGTWLGRAREVPRESCFACDFTASNFEPVEADVARGCFHYFLGVALFRRCLFFSRIFTR
jgi:hypothetical protein